MSQAGSEAYPWISKTCRGYLTYPAPFFVSLIEKFEVVFSNLHSKSFSKQKHVQGGPLIRG